jgi:hypothetical protein
VKIKIKIMKAANKIKAMPSMRAFLVFQNKI